MIDLRYRKHIEYTRVKFLLKMKLISRIHLNIYYFFSVSVAIPSESSSVNTVLIAGIIVGILVLAAVVAAVVGVILCKKKNKVRTQSNENGSEHLG